MTPPPAATEYAPAGLGLQVAESLRAPGLARAIEPRGWLRLRFLLDAIVLSLAASAAVFGPAAHQLSSGSRLAAAAFPMLALALLYLRHSPDDRLSQSAIDIVSHVVGVMSIAAMLELLAEAALGSPHPLALPLRLWVFAIVYLGIARVVLRSLRRHAYTFDAFSTPTLIVGAGMVGQQITRRLLEDRTYGLRPVGMIDADPLMARDDGGAGDVPVLGGADDLLHAINTTGARQLILAYSSDPDSMLIEKLEVCRGLGVDILLVPRLYELMNERSTLDHVGGLPVVTLRSTNPRSAEFAVKHALDRVAAAAALVVLSPVMLTIAGLVRLSSPGPVLFRQRRVGRDGREFCLLKFRSMSSAPPAAGDEFALKRGLAPGGVEGHDRRTRLGRALRRSSLDELPQLINVLRGEMSIVGPRPERPAYVEQFAAEVGGYDRRHRVRSGITGWAQVLGLRGQTSISDRVEWDNFYIQNWSLWLDLKIIVLTLVEVFRFRG